MACRADEHVDAAELSLAEFADRVDHAVDAAWAKAVVIVSLDGHQGRMPHETALGSHVLQLILYLDRRGATMPLTMAQNGLVNDATSPVDVTSLADKAILLRWFEAFGHIRRAVRVSKNRTGPHETTIRAI